MAGRAAGSDLGWDPAPEQGWVAPRIAEEFPGLGISWLEVDGRSERSSESARMRLRTLSDRFYGGHAIHMREQPIPWAYRVFFRQIGLDPDRTRTPVERLALDRLHDGAFVTHGMPDDALTIAIAETGVAVRAFDSDRLQGQLCIRDSAPGEALPGKPAELEQGTLIIADKSAPVELLFGGTAERGVGRDTRRITFAAVQVKGVPQAAVDEALWIASSTLQVG